MILHDDDPAYQFMSDIESLYLHKYALIITGQRRIIMKYRNTHRSSARIGDTIDASRPLNVLEWIDHFSDLVAWVTSCTCWHTWHSCRTPFSFLAKMSIIGQLMSSTKVKWNKHNIDTWLRFNTGGYRKQRSNREKESDSIRKFWTNPEPVTNWKDFWRKKRLKVATTFSRENLNKQKVNRVDARVDKKKTYIS